MTAWTEAAARGATGPELDRAFHLDVADFAGWLPETGPMPPRRVLMRDRSLPHQIMLTYGQRRCKPNQIFVGCNCGRLHEPITEAPEAFAAYRRHLTKEGITDARAIRDVRRDL